MEIEAKITNQEVKQKLWIFEWDRTKYRILGRRVRGIVLVIFAFFLGYTLVTVMNQSQATVKSPMVTSTFDIMPAQEVVSKDSVFLLSKNCADLIPPPFQSGYQIAVGVRMDIGVSRNRSGTKSSHWKLNYR